MKNIILILALVLSMVSIYAQIAQQELDKAIYLEEVDGDLDQAMELYQNIVQNFKDERTIVAEALYRTGLVNEKLGNKKAVSYYENLIKNYGDQSKQVTMAKKRLKSIYASMNVEKEEESGVVLRKVYSTKGKIFGSISHNGKYYCAYENLNLYLYNLASGKKTAITTEGKTDSVSVNAMPGIWSLDDSKVAFSWHHGNDIWSLKIWNRINNEVMTVVEPGEFIYPINWTHDGKKLFVVYGPERTVETHLGILNINNGSRNELFNQGQLWQDFATLSPDGQYVIHTKNSENGDKDLYLFSVSDKSNLLISNNSSNEKAFWAYDGKSVILESKRSGNPALYEWKFQNGKMVGDPLLIYEGINEGFDVECMRKNGEIILRNLHIQSSIYLAEVDFQIGKIFDQKLLIDNASDYFLPTWSPDGNWIAMYKKGNAPNSTNLVISDLQGKIHKDIELGFNVNNKDYMNPSWTPDGKIGIPYDRSADGKTFELVMVDPENGNTESFVPAYNNQPIFASEDFYYLSLDEQTNAEAYGIMRVNRNTKEQEMIYRCADNTLPGPLSLSPDMKKLIFRLITKSGDKHSDHALVLLNLQNLSTKEVFKVNTQERYFKQPSWYPDSRSIQFNMVEVDSKTGLFKDGEEKIVELNTITSEHKILPRLPLGKDESIPWRVRNINYQIGPDGKHVIFTKSNATSNFWTLKY